MGRSYSVPNGLLGQIMQLPRSCTGYVVQAAHLKSPEVRCGACFNLEVRELLFVDRSLAYVGLRIGAWRQFGQTQTLVELHALLHGRGQPETGAPTSGSHSRIGPMQCKEPLALSKGQCGLQRPSSAENSTPSAAGDGLRVHHPPCDCLLPGGQPLCCHATCSTGIQMLALVLFAVAWLRPRFHP